ncbi:helix-turn-helix domain-containing protein [Psychrobacillus sp. AK 1817]|uniref:Helix-turn-helix domain-containing protein n=1 Tax=Psychrobacillus faecigallinarum TaxID=2762235 RepID=A0ABR8R4C0_9BACI|nr:MULTISPECIES: RodZ domain-containing protein [Psychrobacillus]MBD7942631.1 helix-turn-helix domain-containing protein [Psychrobacillus faecigallinarum]QEY20112.1 helix-turn-helix domain-containing protein [Psychrobacillus sp. AK 1817]
MTELGTRLKEARIAKGYSIEDLQEITKIQKRYLANIEEGNYSTMPGAFYVRAFIKQYAEAVGLNGDELLETYKAEIPSPANEEVAKSIPTTPSRRTLGGRSSNKFMEIVPMIIVALFIVAIIVIVWVLRQNSPEADDSSELKTEENVTLETNRPSTDQTAVDNEEEEKEKEAVVEEEEEAEKPTPEQVVTLVGTEGETTTYTVSGSETFKLKVVANSAKTWLNLKDQDSNKLYDSWVNSGTPYELDVTDKSQIRVRVGDVPISEVYINDQLVEFPTDKSPQNLVIQFNK